MLLRWFLFETKAGEMLLSLFERATGLAVVSVEWLETQPSGELRSADGQDVEALPAQVGRAYDLGKLKVRPTFYYSMQGAKRKRSTLSRLSRLTNRWAWVSGRRGTCSDRLATRQIVTFGIRASQCAIRRSPPLP